MQIIRGVILFFLVLGFWQVFGRLALLSRLADLLKRTRLDMDAASRQRNLAERQRLLELQSNNSLWYRIDRLLSYTGIRQHFPGIQVENWLLVQLLACTVLLFVVTVCLDFMAAVGLVLGLLAGEWLILGLLRWRNYNKTEESLTKLLDFLGNYSLSAGEITAVLGQVSRYMEEPIKGALDSCCYEAATTGDAGKALLVMGERLEHPKFKELAKNMEISLRYCADFSLLVESSRRSLREYMRYSKERKGMLREAAIGMLLLVGMSVAALILVVNLIGGLGAI